MFWSKNKKNRYTPAYPSFFYIKVGFKGVDASRTCFPDDKAYGVESPEEKQTAIKIRQKYFFTYINFAHDLRMQFRQLSSCKCLHLNRFLSA